jgi:hypothetical protein
MSAIVWIVKIVLISVLIKFSSDSAHDLYYGIHNGVTVNIARSQMKKLHNHFMDYINRTGKYPEDSRDLQNFLNTEFEIPLEQILMDPWKNPYIFFSNRGEIVSWGSDKKPETGDDLIIPYPDAVDPSIHH